MRERDFYVQYFADTKNVCTPEPALENKDDDSSVVDKETVILALRLIEKAREDIISIKESINTIAHYVGMPYKAKNICLSFSPAFIDGSQRAYPGYIGYTVDLTPYRDNFSYVRFQACTPLNDEKLVRAYILDDEGNIESYINEDGICNYEWARMPLGPGSMKLVVTLPLSEGGVPVFTPRYVELIPNGVSLKLCQVRERVGNLSAFVGFNNECA